ncbi:MAG: hypothetical protein E6K10_07535 [Methanobacteriota archaeon]|nr:MAG: hypothetical protein E6K10_07535 [Euryarchaeota archaeon]
MIPVSVGLDRTPPAISAFSLSTLGGRLNDMDNRTTTDPSPSLVWSLSDPSRGELDVTRIVLTADGTDVTSDAGISIPLAANAQGVQAFWEGVVTYRPRALAEGVHDITLTVGDMAGNLASRSTTIVLDTTAPPVAVDGPPLRFTRSNLADLTARSQPGSFVSFGGAWIPVDASGAVTTTVTLSPGMNEFMIAAADWFDHDIDGSPLPGNANTARITIVQDSRAPQFTRAPASDEPLTRADGALIRGTVADTIAPGVPWPANDLMLTIAGVRTDVHADGTFASVVPLSEGSNPIAVVAVDPAGNDAIAWANVTRDTAAPTLTVDALPERTYEGRIVVSGRAEPGSIVTVNGVVVTLAGDRFARNVTLSGGENVIVVRAEDPAGNAAEARSSVSFVAPPSSSAGAIAGIAAGSIVAFLVVLLLARRFLFPPAGGPPGDNPATSETPGAPEPATEEETPIGEAPPGAPTTGDEFASMGEVEPSREEDPRVAKLREAFESGKISREVYEANVKRLGKTP